MANILNVITAVTPMGGTISKLRLLMERSQHNHVIYQPGYDENKEEIEQELKYYQQKGIPAYYGIYNRNILKNVLEIKKIVKRHNINIVHFYFNYEQTFVYLLKFMLPGVKFVRSYVGYIELSKVRRQFMVPSVQLIDENIYISKYIKNQYENLYPSLKKRNSTIIYNCPVKVRATEDLDRELILYVGGLNKAKNVPLLIEMMNSTVNELGRKDIKLSIVGDGPDRPMIEGMISKFKINDNVELLGYRKDIPELLNRTKVYVHSATNEGFGISVVEAMYMKCPCLLAKASALPELIDEKCGYILPVDRPIEWAKKLVELVDDKIKARQMGNNAYNRANAIFSIDSFVENHDRLYYRLSKK